MGDYRVNWLKRARDLVEEGELDQGVEIATRFLKLDPNDVVALTVLTAAMIRANKLPIAYHLSKRLGELAPDKPSSWINLGMACNELWLEAETEEAYRKGLEVCDSDHAHKMLLTNMAALMIDTGRFEEAVPYLETILKSEPGHKKALSNLGFCQLAARNWSEGWKNYHHCLGTDWRKANQYLEEPEWDGSPGKHVVLYGEQGLGDEVSFASMVPDALKVCKKVVIDCDKRLEGLFKRSFPEAKVYGTRGATELPWAREDAEGIEASLPLGQLGEFFRLKDEDFPGTPYLKPDPDRVLMWNALWQSKRKPVIGIAWRGGILRTGAKHRQWDLEQLLPILKSVDAHWVSLQYKPAQGEIDEFLKAHPKIDIKEYPHGVLTQDYDDTAALVASLDMVICMQTAVAHLAGALGIPCWVFVPKSSQWRYGTEGETIPWYKSLRVIRQRERGEWKREISQAAEQLSKRFAELEVVNAD